MGLLDRWLDRFLSDDDLAEEDCGQAFEPEEQPQKPKEEAPKDPLDEAIQRARARLTLDESGRRYAESNDFFAELSSLDAGGRSRAADALLADALLVSPSLELRRRLAERLLYRGDRDAARTLLLQLTCAEAHAPFAWMKLAEIAEHHGDREEALRAYERVLALDITLEQPKARARRLRAGKESRMWGQAQGRAVLTRFLGARAAGTRYAVLEEIGRGGAATVFRARDRVVEREVALKIFHPRGKTADRRARIVQEARVAGAFDHPHIVPILDIDEERDLLVMALCDGGALRQRLQKGKLRVAEAAEIGAVLFRTLADIHDAGRLHLDVKPSNLLFHGGQLMLCDFGTAGLKEMGAAAGTRAYMAPEQRRHGRGGKEADIWASGLVLFECIEGVLPPLGEGEAGVRLKTLPEGPRRRALERLFRRLLNPDPERRAKDARGVADELLEAAALPITDKEGTACLERLLALAEGAGPEAKKRLLGHRIAEVLRPPA